MPDYDFLNLSPNEFENISRDLLQKKLGVFIESFTTGKDGGVDLRYSTDKFKTIIIQAKRYKDYSSLYNHLKKEVDKVVNLKPDKYILTTSVGLTPDNKAKILKLFSPYIKRNEDILGRDDLNNLIGQHKEIERKYYKLWITSTNVLEKILHSKIYNQSAFELEEIKEQVKLYVQNDSFAEALNILKTHHYVIISGIPGIGKTTLARILILFLLSAEFEEFVYLADSIDDGYEFFADGKKQVFFFDDFLGKVRFDAKNLANTDSKIVKFIDKIKKTPDKILILATREYILSQARNWFEIFNISNIEIAKCILDLSSYTKIIKAQIIYNHLFFSNVPQAHLKNLIENENYLKLVNHENYNPRILETVINKRIWEYCSPDEFTKAFKSYFDNPQSVWESSFDNSLDKFSQYTLLVLLTLGTPVLIEDLELAVKEFLINNGYKLFISFDSIKFKRAIRELENTFIKTKKDSYDAIVVEFQNPSIQDFLINYLRDKDDLISSLINASLYSDQFFNIFSTGINTDISINRFIKLSDKQIQISINRIKNIYSRITTSRILKLKEHGTETFRWYRYKSFVYSFLMYINKKFASKNEDAKNFVYESFQDLVILSEDSYLEQSSYLELLSTLELSKLTFSGKVLIEKYIDNIGWIDNIQIFSKIGKIFPSDYQTIVENKTFIDKVSTVVESEIDSVEDSDIHGLIDKIKSLETLFAIDYSTEIEDLQKREIKYNDFLESEIESYIDNQRESDEAKGLSEQEENVIIYKIFNSLVEN